jgi:hypothetical protein
LINYADYVRLQSTCKSLKSMLPKMPNHQLSQVPWLMLPHDNVSENTRFSFLNPLENKMYNLDIPEVKGMLLCGSSYGWILAVDGYPKLCLINPFTFEIQLPTLDSTIVMLGPIESHSTSSAGSTDFQKDISTSSDIEPDVSSSESTAESFNSAALSGDSRERSKRAIKRPSYLEDYILYK